jgi:hypothetical protein
VGQLLPEVEVPAAVLELARLLHVHLVVRRQLRSGLGSILQNSILSVNFSNNFTL